MGLIMNNITYIDTKQYGWRRMLSVVAALAALIVLTFALTGCFGSSSDDDDDGVIYDDDGVAYIAPGEPMDFTVYRPGDALLTAELSWSVPVTGGDPVSYEIYRSTTPLQVFQEDNKIFSVAAVAGETIYTYTDNVGLSNDDTYWVVAAKNPGGETPTLEVSFRPIGPPGGTGDDEGYGNNFAAAMIFADNIGISGLDLDGSLVWTTDPASIDTNTGMRPSAEEVANILDQTDPVTELPYVLPYLDDTSIFVLDGVDYWTQKTVSTWQGQWVNGADENQNVNGAWGDNLISQSLTTNSVIRIEMVLTKAIDPSVTPLTSYTMKSLYGTKLNEVFGTDGTSYEPTSAFVFASNAHLTIQKLDDNGNTDGSPLYDQNLWGGDGPGNLGAEINVAGNFTYGFVWALNKIDVLPDDIKTGKEGTWRITFLLDSDNSGSGATPANNNTFIESVTNGVRVSDTEVYIDINIAP